MLVELVDVEAADGLKLNGAVHRPEPNATPSCGVDAVLCLHGAWSQFYGSFISGMARHATRWGATALSVNTRGHDGICSARRGNSMVMAGGAYEIVDECRLDVAAWLDFLAGRGFSRIALLGHSLGAVKAIYAAAHGAQERVAAVVAISPPRLSHAHFAASERGGDHRGEYERAAALVAEGRGQTLFEIRFPMPQVISAAAYIDKYGPDERYNVLKYLDRLRVPALLTYGSVELEQGAAFRGMPDEVESRRATLPNLQSAVIAGADHIYSGVASDLATRIELWLRRALAAA